MNSVCLLQIEEVDLNSMDLLHKGFAITKDVSEMTPEATAKFILKWDKDKERKRR